MIKAETRKWILVGVAIVALAGCYRTGPLTNVTDTPMPKAGDRSLTLDQVAQAIVAAGEKRGWEMQIEKPGHIVATLQVRSHMAVVDIPYTTKSYSILYSSSDNLNYDQDAKKIHKNYNEWVANLNVTIQQELAKGGKPKPHPSAQVQAPVSKQDVPSSKQEVLISKVTPSDVDKPRISRSGSRKHRHAIVIGVEQYRNNLPQADFAAHDAEIMGQYLTKTMGYPEENVIVLLNERAARTDLEKYVEKWLPNRVDKGDSVFIYFSGHGAPNPKTGDAYLVPYDGDPSYIDTTGYPLKRLYENLEKLPTGETVVLLDSCFSGAGGRSVVPKGMRPMVLTVENPVLASGKTVVLTASSGEQVSSTYDAKGHGLFTYFVLKGLQGEADQNKDGAVDMQEVFDYIKPQVERVARREYNNEQIPQLLGSPDVLKKIRLLDAAKP